MKPGLASAVVGAVAALIAGAAHSLTLEAPGRPPITVSAAELAGMPHQSVSGTEHGQAHTYAGVPLGLLLARLGAPQGEAVRGKAMTTLVVVAGADGYRVVLTLPDVDPDFRAERVILADAEDGHPLDARAGPLRLVVEGDRRPARWVRGVSSIEVASLP